MPNPRISPFAVFNPSSSTSRLPVASGAPAYSYSDRDGVPPPRGPLLPPPLNNSRVDPYRPRGVVCAQSDLPPPRVVGYAGGNRRPVARPLASASRPDSSSFIAGGFLRVGEHNNSSVSVVNHSSGDSGHILPSSSSLLVPSSLPSSSAVGIGERRLNPCSSFQGGPFSKRPRTSLPPWVSGWGWGVLSPC